MGRWQNCHSVLWVCVLLWMFVWKWVRFCIYICTYLYNREFTIMNIFKNLNFVHIISYKYINRPISTWNERFQVSDQTHFQAPHKFQSPPITPCNITRLLGCLSSVGGEWGKKWVKEVEEDGWMDEKVNGMRKRLEYKWRIDILKRE